MEAHHLPLVGLVACPYATPANPPLQSLHVLPPSQMLGAQTPLCYNIRRFYPSVSTVSSLIPRSKSLVLCRTC
jgi:hypothetical protein